MGASEKDGLPAPPAALQTEEEAILTAAAAHQNVAEVIKMITAETTIQVAAAADTPTAAT